MAEENTLLGNEEETKVDAAVEEKAVEAKEPVESTESKEPEDQKTDEGKSESTKEQGDISLKTPEGVEVNEEHLNAFTSEVKELGLDNTQAQKLMDLHFKFHQETLTAQQDAWAEINENWVKEAKEDKEIGGKKFDTTVDQAKQAINKFGSDKFKEALNLTGLGNHPEMIRFLSNVAKGFGEDKMVTGDASNSGPRDPADILFPNHNK